MSFNLKRNSYRIFSSGTGVFFTITSALVGTAFAMDTLETVPFVHRTPDMIDDKVHFESSPLGEVSFINPTEERISYDGSKLNEVEIDQSFPQEDILEYVNVVNASLNTESWIKVPYDHKTFGLGSYEVSQTIIDAVTDASNSTGVGIGYLLGVASKESSFRVNVKAPTSSAKGLFQMTNQTWSDTIAKLGADYGYQSQAAHLKKNSKGKLYYTSSRARKEILSMRDKPEHAAMITAALSVDNGRRLRKMLGRDVSQSELYIAHFLGVTNASKLIKYAGTKPNSYPRSYRSFKAAINANKNIFINKKTGKHRTFRQVYNLISKDMENRIAYYSLEFAKISSEEHKLARVHLNNIIN